MTTPVRTAFDLGRQPHRARGLIALDAFCHRLFVRPAEIADYAAARPRWPGVARLRVLLDLVDLAYPQWRIALEYEGDHHRERTQFRRDIARLNALREAGWVVLRCTADDVLRHPQKLVAQLLAAIRERA